MDFHGEQVVWFRLISRSYFGKGCIFLPSLNISSHSIIVRSCHHPCGLNDKHLAVLIFHQVLVLQTIQPSCVMLHTVVWLSSIHHVIHTLNILEIRSNKRIGVFLEHLCLLFDSVRVHYVVSILKAKETTVWLFHTPIFGESAASKRSLILGIDDRNTFLLEMVNPAIDYLLRFVCAAVIVNWNLDVWNPSEPTSSVPEYVCLSMPSKHSSKYASSLWTAN